ncbi:hypothetical protein [Streptomyces sp. NPDC006784]|uniref:hypothetical protein n=1 Tax=Streptomyces sp. NPDC006784 TaxID=3364764 RepID=UPI0036935324
MSTSSQNRHPVPDWEEARQQIADLVYGTYGQHDHDRTYAIADAVMPAVRTAVDSVLATAVDLARDEYLTDNTGTDEDEAYNRAVSDVAASIDKLRKGGVQR